jgi:hypothetical protein
MSESIDSATDSNTTCSEAISAVMDVRYSVAFCGDAVDGYIEKSGFRLTLRHISGKDNRNIVRIRYRR